MDLATIEESNGDFGRVSMVNTPGNEASVSKKGPTYYSIQLS